MDPLSTLVVMASLVHTIGELEKGFSDGDDYLSSVQLQELKKAIWTLDTLSSSLRETNNSDGWDFTWLGQEILSLAEECRLKAQKPSKSLFNSFEKNRIYKDTQLKWAIRSDRRQNVFHELRTRIHVLSARLTTKFLLQIQ